MGLTPLTLWLACLLAIRNQRILTAWTARQAGDARRAATGLPPKTRRRRRTTVADLITAPPLPGTPSPRPQETPAITTGATAGHQQDSASPPGTHPRSRTVTYNTRDRHGTGRSDCRATMRTRMSDPNVKINAGQT